MSNLLVTALAQNVETFKDARLYLYRFFNNSKEKVLQLENTNIDTCVPYYINYIESRDIDFQEAMNYFVYETPGSSYWELVKITIVNTFRKLENKDLNFIPY